MSVRLEVRGVTHRYPNRPAPAIDDITLDVAGGAFLTVLGPSGSGKSTLLAVVAGVERPVRGDVLIDGTSVVDLPAARRDAALVFQQPYLFPHLSVGENVTFGLAARGVPRRTRLVEADRWLGLVGLDGTARRRPRELSGGEQQRVALVRALAARPRVVLLDEPLTGLDPQTRGDLQTLLRDLVRDTGVTTVMVTHDLAEAMALGDRTAVLRDGRLLAEEDPRLLFLRPSTRATAELVGVTTFIAGTPAAGVLRTAAGPLAVNGLPGVTSEVTVAIRPEHVTLVPTPGPNVVPGHVERCVYRGEHWDCDVRTPLGTLRARADTRRDQGANALVGLPADHLFPVG